MENLGNLERIEKTLKQIPFPTRFAVELCADCNLNCSMCHHDQMRRPKGVMPFELWKKCADESAQLAPRTDVWFSFCGEPLMEPDQLIKMLRYGREVGIESLSINTNGQLLLPHLHERLLDLGIQRIVIGIDGLSAPVFEKIRCGAQRDVVYDNVERLLDARRTRETGPEIIVQFIEMDENEHELAAYKAFWFERGATVKVRKKLSWGGKFDTPLDVSFDERIACPWALTMMHVFWDGRVPRCPGDTEGDEGVGNAWHAPLAELWAGLGNWRQHHLSHEFDQLPDRCQTCRDWMVGVAERLRPKQLEPQAVGAHEETALP
ncbi:MAG: radical SAM/SPASM domain-containing protein [Nannocystaceae bacterium]